MADQTKKAETKNQHFVPQFYQRYFSMDKKNIGTYIISSGKNINSAPIKNQSSGNYFYSDKMEIEKILGEMEGLWKKVIDKVIKSPKGNLSREEKYNLYAFTIIQLGRTSAQANLIQEAVNTRLCTIAKKHLEILRNSENSDKYKDITDDELNHISFNFPYPAVLALQTQFQLINTCIDLQFKILINKTKVSFITSNNPAAKYSQFLERMGVKNYALGSRGLQIFIPLTPFIGVMFYDPKCYKLGDRKKNYVELTQEKDIEELTNMHDEWYKAWMASYGPNEAGMSDENFLKTEELLKKYNQNTSSKVNSNKKGDNIKKEDSSNNEKEKNSNTNKENSNTKKQSDTKQYSQSEVIRITNQIQDQIDKLKTEKKDYTELKNLKDKWYEKWSVNGNTTADIPNELSSRTQTELNKYGIDIKKSENQNGENIDATDEDEAEDEDDGLGNPTILKLITGALDGIVGILFWLPKMLLLVTLYTAASIIGAIIGGNFSIESIIFNQAIENPISLISVNFFDKTGSDKDNTNKLIQENIATWYIAIRNIAITILVIVAMYIAIRMLLATTSEKKAQYKEILIYWVQSLALIFVLHYIMIGIIAINDALVKALYKAGEQVVAGKNNDIMETLFGNALKAIKITTSMANTFAYMVLCVVTIMFFISYLKRMMTIAFLITIAPLVTVTYSIDKIGDGKSQALNAWLKEFSYTILIQPFHCITYLALGSIGTKLLTRNDNFADIFIGIYFLSFILQSENIVRGIFGIKPNNLGNVIGEVALISAVAGKMEGKTKGGVQYTGDSSTNRFVGGLERSGGQKRTPIRTASNQQPPTNSSSQQAQTSSGEDWYDNYSTTDARREELNNNPSRTTSENRELAGINNRTTKQLKKRRLRRAAVHGYVGASLGVAAAMAKMAIAVASGDGKAVLAAGFSAKDSITKNMNNAVERASQGDMVDAYKLARKVSPDKDEKYFKDLAKGNISAANEQEQEFVDRLQKHQNIMDKHGKIDDKNLDNNTDTLLDNINNGDLDQHTTAYRAGRWLARRKSA